MKEEGGSEEGGKLGGVGSKFPGAEEFTKEFISTYLIEMVAE